MKLETCLPWYRIGSHRLYYFTETELNEVRRNDGWSFSVEQMVSDNWRLAPRLMMLVDVIGLVEKNQLSVYARRAGVHGPVWRDGHFTSGRVTAQDLSADDWYLVVEGADKPMILSMHAETQVHEARRRAGRLP